METVKEKLRKALKKILIEDDIRLYCRKQEEKNEEGGYLCDDCPYCEKSGCMETLLADRLIQNGVTILECGMDCKSCWKTKIVKPVQEWVSVDERLPEESLDSVMGYDEYRDRCVFVQYCKVIGSWWLNRKLSKIERLLSIALEKDLFIYIGAMEVNKDGEQALGGKE